MAGSIPMIHELQNLSFSSLLDMKINASSFWVVPISVVLCTWSFPFKNNLLLQIYRQSAGSPWFTFHFDLFKPFF
jgi:hypothetical protein